ncbi:DUF2336 domain-containing protein [Hoeflea sp.]|uniref:DUF2336 domain-containing protein n=1 Tax=Hoeflea sp. TaxID=1940281 RepID=UPI003BAF2E6B
MIVKQFLKWFDSATVTQRCHATAALTRAYAQGRIPAEESDGVEAALSMLLDDPSPKVRLALAEGLATAEHAPRSVIRRLAEDQFEVAARIIALSPVLSDNDLIEIVANGRALFQQFVACRSSLSIQVSAALAEVGTRDAVADLLDNVHAPVARISLRRIAERFGDDPELRSRLFDRRDLPCDVRQGLVERLGAALAGSELVRFAIGGNRSRKITDEACINATLTLADVVAAEEIPALVEHLRMSGRLTPAFLMHTLCSGNVDFFAAAVVALSGMGDSRVRGILNDGREAAIRALYRSIGLDRDLAPVFVTATLMWRAASRRQAGIDVGSVTRELMRQHASDSGRVPAVGELLRLVETLHLNWHRQSSRDYAHALAVEPAVAA